MAEVVQYLVRIVGMAVCKNREVKSNAWGIMENDIGWVAVIVLWANKEMQEGGENWMK